MNAPPFVAGQLRRAIGSRGYTLTQGQGVASMQDPIAIGGESMLLAGFTVGQAAKTIGISTKAIRLYESRGLLPEVRRSVSGYRLYDETDLGILRFIRRARSIGLGLDEIKDVLALQRSGQQTCGRVVSLLDAHITGIDRALADLYALRATLCGARDAANSGDGQKGAVVCRIIEAEIPEARVGR